MESLQQETNIPLLLWHDHRAFPIGMAEKWTHKPDGLYGLWKMDTAEQAKKAARHASISYLGLSIGFLSTPEGTDYQTEDDGLWVTRLTEGYPTPVPAYAGARITLARLDG